MSDPIDVDGQKYFHETYVKELRDEAAQSRIEKNDAVTAAKNETATEYQSKVDELEQKLNASTTEVDAGRMEVVKLKTALEAGIESDKVMTFASLLQGQTEDELKSHAAEVKQLFAAPAPTPDPKDPPVDPSQGSGNPLPLNGDPLLNAVMGIVNK